MSANLYRASTLLDLEDGSEIELLIDKSLTWKKGFVNYRMRDHITVQLRDGEFYANMPLNGSRRRELLKALI